MGDDDEMPDSEAVWACPNCTLDNEESATACAACEQPRPEEAAEEGEEEEEEYEDGEEEEEEEEEGDEEEGEEEEEEEDEEEDYDGGLAESMGDYYESDDADVADLLAGAGDDFDNVVGDALSKLGRSKVEAVIGTALAHHGSENVVILPQEADDSSVVVRAAVHTREFLDAQTARIWGVKTTMPVVLELKFQGPLYTEDTKVPPVFSVFQSSDSDLSKPRLETRLTFGLEWQLRSRLDLWLNQPDVWPAATSANRGRDFLLNAMAHTVQRILDCTRTCIICDSELPLQMVKPSVCNDMLCVHSYEQYGLGADVATEIRESPESVDLLISVLYAATQGDIRRFNPFPVGVQATVPRDDGMPGTTTVDFMKSGWNSASSLLTDGAGAGAGGSGASGPSSKRKGGGAAAAAAGGGRSGKREASPAKDFSAFADPTRVREVLDVMPPVRELADAGDTAALKAILDASDPLVFPLLRWIITSNRAHLQRLSKKDQISKMNTDMQFKFISSPPEKEAGFQARKKQHGSFYAFHGSSFANWHAILRNGLKNMSGTALMSTGAAYGAGIYLSPNAGTSSGYSRGQPGWPKSMLGGSGAGASSSMSCLCICEVINKKAYAPKPHCVVGDEDDVMTRYFFIYNNSSGGIPSVTADSLKLK